MELTAYLIFVSVLLVGATSLLAFILVRFVMGVLTRINRLEEEQSHMRLTHSQVDGIEDWTANMIPWLRKKQEEYERVQNELAWANKMIEIMHQLRAGPYAYSNKKDKR